MQHPTPTFPGMEATLQDACERAIQRALPLPIMLRLYRSVAGLTRALMQARADVGLPPGLNDDLVALLEKVRDTVGMHFPDPDMPVNDVLRLHTAAMALARAAHRARAGRVLGRLPKAPSPQAPDPQEPHPEPAARPDETNPTDPNADLDTPRPVDFRVKILSGDKLRDVISRRYRPNDDLEGDYAEAQRLTAGRLQESAADSR